MPDPTVPSAFSIFAHAEKNPFQPSSTVDLHFVQKSTPNFKTKFYIKTGYAANTTRSLCGQNVCALKKCTNLHTLKN